MTESFWDWAVAVYAKPGVAEACLDLQDAHDQIVPLILWAAWASVSGYEIDEVRRDAAVSVAQTWAEAVVAPLRLIRRRLKSPLTAGDTEARLGLREKIKAVELQSERALMAELERLMIGCDFENGVLNQRLAPDLATAMVRVAQTGGDEPVKMAFDRLAEALIKR